MPRRVSRQGVLSALTLALALTVNQSVHAQSGPAYRPVVIFIHGRGLGGLDPDSVRTALEKAFREGQDKIGFGEVRGDDDFRLVWYGSVLLNYYCREQE